MYKNQQIAGIFWMILHCFIISNIVIIAKILGNSGYNPFQIIFFHSFIAFLIILPFAIKKYGRNILKTQCLNAHLTRSFLGVISLFIYFFALKFVNLNDARAIALFNPIITFIFGVFLLKEHINNKKIAALVLSLIGGFIIINPTSPSFHSALILVIIAMFMWSIIDLAIKKISKDESNVKQMLFLTFLSSLFCLIPTILYWKKPVEIYDISLLTLMGILFVINVTAIFLAFKNADLTTIMPFDFSGMVFTTILTYFIFNELINLNIVIGSIIIFSSSLYLIFHEKRKSRNLIQ
jgi:drug/metabolite transporter (DMT)-like permease